MIKSKSRIVHEFIIIDFDSASSLVTIPTSLKFDFSSSLLL